MIVFETERLYVRHYNIADIEEFYLLNSDEEIMRYIRPVKNRIETDVFLRQVLQQTKDYPLTGRWAVDEKDGGKAIGSFAIIPVDNTHKMQLGYALLKDAWGKGYATELTRAGLEYVFSKTPLLEIYAITEKANVASQMVLVKAGFRRVEDYVEGGKELAQFVYDKPDMR